MGRGVIGLAFVATVVLGVALAVVLLEVEVSLRWRAVGITSAAESISHNVEKGGSGGAGGGVGSGGHGADDGGEGEEGAKRAYTVSFYCNKSNSVDA